MKLDVRAEAADAIRKKRVWWEAHRQKAPRLFSVELATALKKIRHGTDVARQRYSGEGDATVWRLLLPKTRHHLYYQRDERTNTATVLLVANAISETGPDL